MKTKERRCVLGKYDIPLLQAQPDFCVDLFDANIAVFGSAMSGKTTFVKNLVNILHKKYDVASEQVFILDFGGSLAEYRDMPLVSAYFDNSNEEYVKRVFKILDKTLQDNINVLKGKNFRDAQHSLPHTTFVIDNVNAFKDEPRYGEYYEKLLKLCRDGLSKGITVVVTAVETRGITSLLGSIKQKIAFDMPQESYADIFTGKVPQIGSNAGRGFANITCKLTGVTGTYRMNAPYEIQCTLPYAPDDAQGCGDTEAKFDEELKKKFGFSEGTYTCHVKKYQIFPQELTQTEYEKLKQNSVNAKSDMKTPVSVGLDYVEFCPVEVDLEQAHVLGIYGKKAFGKTNLLNLLMRGLLQAKPSARIVLFDDGRKQLQALGKLLGSQGKDVCVIDEYKQEDLVLLASDNKPLATVPKKLSPVEQFLLYLHRNYIDLTSLVVKRLYSDIVGFNANLTKDQERVPKTADRENPFTVFVIQSKHIYLDNSFLKNTLPQLAAVAEDNGYLFIFSDVQRISDNELNPYFNNSLSTVFLLDNIAEFVSERGAKTVFGSMDAKALKEEYARCEKGDGYYYDIEADNLVKLKYIKYE